MHTVRYWAESHLAKIDIVHWCEAVHIGQIIMMLLLFFFFFLKTLFRLKEMLQPSRMVLKKIISRFFMLISEIASNNLKLVYIIKKGLKYLSVKFLIYFDNFLAS